MNVLPGKGKLRHWLNNYIGRTGGCVTDLHARSEQCEIDELASVDRQVLNLLLVDNRADHRPCGLRHFADVLDLNSFGKLADGKTKVNAADGTEIEVHLLCGFLEAALFDSHRVFPGRQKRDLVIAGGRSIGLVRYAGFGIHGCDRSFGDRSARRVIDASLDGTGNGLSAHPT